MEVVYRWSLNALRVVFAPSGLMASKSCLCIMVDVNVDVYNFCTISYLHIQIGVGSKAWCDTSVLLWAWLKCVLCVCVCLNSGVALALVKKSHMTPSSGKDLTAHEIKSKSAREYVLAFAQKCQIPLVYSCFLVARRHPELLLRPLAFHRHIRYGARRLFELGAQHPYKLLFFPH